jgi:hypothetical protein
MEDHAQLFPMHTKLDHRLTRVVVNVLQLIRCIKSPQVVSLKYDPTKCTFEDLAKFFYTFHDPTTFNRQGNDACVYEVLHWQAFLLF